MCWDNRAGCAPFPEGPPCSIPGCLWVGWGPPSPCGPRGANTGGLEKPWQHLSSGWRGKKLGNNRIIYKIYNRLKPSSPVRMLMLAGGEGAPGWAQPPGATSHSQGWGASALNAGVSLRPKLCPVGKGLGCFPRELIPLRRLDLGRCSSVGRMVPGWDHPEPWRSVGTGQAGAHGCVPIPGLGRGSSPASYKLLLLPFF